MDDALRELAALRACYADAARSNRELLAELEALRTSFSLLRVDVKRLIALESAQAAAAEAAVSRLRAELLALLHQAPDRRALPPLFDRDLN